MDERWVRIENNTQKDKGKKEDGDQRNKSIFLYQNQRRFCT